MKRPKRFYPEIITKLPKADIPFKGITGKLFQGIDHQIVFMEIDAIGIVPPHSHGAQWGVVLDGKMKLTIDGTTRIYGKGDTYFIPAGVVHSADFMTKVFVLDFFEDKDRYAKKPERE